MFTNNEDQDDGDNLVNVSANVITKFAKYIKFTDENVTPLPPTPPLTLIGKGIYRYDFQAKANYERFCSKN
jgi:hypothetical protein